MKAIKDGGPAFPGGVAPAYTDIECGSPTQGGMTLRDYFAAHALPAVIAAYVDGNGRRICRDSPPTIAYQMADAMLAEREKTS